MHVDDELPIFDGPPLIVSIGNSHAHAVRNTSISVDNCCGGDPSPRKTGLNAERSFLGLIVIEAPRLGVEQMRRERGIAAQQAIPHAGAGVPKVFFHVACVWRFENDEARHAAIPLRFFRRGLVL